MILICNTYFILRWLVPTSVVSGNNSTPSKVMMDREEVSSIIKLPEVSSADLIKINPGVVGYYKVNYDLKELSKLYDAVS